MTAEHTHFDPGVWFLSSVLELYIYIKLLIALVYLISDSGGV